ncbi:MAG: 50S ribosomal protein L6 [Actinomycetota bacterium]|nr:50S ribosomal protein L6 [Actinomycetota bacterium]
MSRIGKMPIELPAGVEYKFENKVFTAKGPKGSLERSMPGGIKVSEEEGKIVVERLSDSREDRSFHGLARSLIANMIKGVSIGFEKQLEIVGVGYRAAVKGEGFELQVGYSNPVMMDLPKGIEVEIPVPTKIILRGIDNEALGDFAAKVRAVRGPEPYKGKGIKYAGEKIRRKAGKASK